MENSLRILERHEDSLATRHVLVVGADDSAFQSLPCASLCVHSDDGSLFPSSASVTSSMLPHVPAQTDLIIVVLPKSRPQLAFWLSSVCGQITRPTEVWLVGAASGGIRGGVTTLKEFSASATQFDSARHCKLFAGELQAAPFELEKFATRWRHAELEMVSYPGVFSHGRLDAGTLLMLELLAGHSPHFGSALDIGCGAGVISAVLAKRGTKVTSIDVSATAVAATQRTFAENNLAENCLQSDVFSNVSDRFDAIVTNPPFHDGTRRTTEVTQRLIREAPQYLNKGGALWLVANQGLPYADALHAAFKHVEVVGENRHFKVWKAQ